MTEPCLTAVNSVPTITAILLAVLNVTPRRMRTAASLHRDHEIACAVTTRRHP